MALDNILDVSYGGLDISNITITDLSKVAYNI